MTVLLKYSRPVVYNRGPGPTKRPQQTSRIPNLASELPEMHIRFDGLSNIVLDTEVGLLDLKKKHLSEHRQT